MAPRPLFHKFDLYAVQQRQQQQAREAVRQLPPERLGEDEETLIAKIVTDFTMDLPSLDEANIYQSDKQVQLDARRLPNRFIFNRSHPVLVDGTEITIHIPFKGDPAMFDVIPSTQTMSPPIGEVDDTSCEVLLTYQTAEADSPIKAQYERTLQEIKQHLEWLRPATTQTDSLKQAVRSELVKRKQAAESHSRVVDSLGLPKRPPKQS